MNDWKIELEGVSKRYGKLLALDGLNLKVAGGEIYGFLGPNGAGKTTAVRLMAGLLHPSAGRIRIAGVDVQADPVEAKRRIGLVPDHAVVYPKLTGRELLDLIRQVHHLDGPESRSREEELTERLGLAPLLGSLAESYSRGQKQRLAVAMALLPRPEVILLDEPLVGLDPPGARALREILKEEASRGAAVFLSTHTLEIVSAICGRIGILQKGRLLREGTLEELSRAAGGEKNLEEIYLRLSGDHGS